MKKEVNKTDNDEFYQRVIFDCLVCLKKLSKFYNSNEILDITRHSLISLLELSLTHYDEKQIRNDAMKKTTRRAFYVKGRFYRLADEKLPKYTLSYDWWFDLDKVLGVHNTDKLFSKEVFPNYTYQPITGLPDYRITDKPFINS